jgi:hypothetical protein
LRFSLSPITDRQLTTRPLSTEPIIVEQPLAYPAMLILGSNGPSCGDGLLSEFWMSFEIGTYLDVDLSGFDETYSHALITQLLNDGPLGC